jgi:hypothetical protein
MLTKVCRVCKVEKELSGFHPNKSCTLGVTGTCRKCNGSRISAWYRSKRKVRQDAANNRNRHKKQLLVDHFGNKCADCGLSFPNCVYQFHHLNPEDKDANPSYAMAGSLETMWKEIQKCIMLCANCHLIRHHPNERGPSIATAN